MARTEMNATKITRAGTDGGAGAAGIADGHMFRNTGSEFLEVENTDGAAAHTVTIPTTTEFEGLALADLAVSIPAASRRLIGPFEPHVFDRKAGTPDAGKVYVDYAVGAHASFLTRVLSL